MTNLPTQQLSNACTTAVEIRSKKHMAPLAFAVLLLLCLHACVAWLSASSGWRRPSTTRCFGSSSPDCGPCPLAPKCSGADRGSGCDGTGKIQGGIATIGFMSWWPIKVYRPCPSYLAAGYQYRREGQTMDQVLFSEPSTKQQEAWAKIQAERQASAQTGAVDKAQTEAERRVNLSEAEKFLEDKLGR